MSLNATYPAVPDRAVNREEKGATKIRAVFDSSCSSYGPTLNGYLHSGPNLLSKTFDFLLRFRLNKVDILADKKQAFLKVVNCKNISIICTFYGLKVWVFKQTKI